MTKLNELLVDIAPSPIYRLCYWIKKRPRQIKWWFQRANHKVPACDCWEFNSSLANYIVQGLDYLLDKGATDWNNPIHRQQYKELDFARKTLKQFIDWHDNYRITSDKESYEKYKDQDKWILYVSKQEFEQHEKNVKKAMGYIGKWLWGLWD